MRRALDALFDAAGALAALAVFLIFVLMITASIGRFAGWRVGGINDIVSWLTAAAAFLAMAHAFKHGDFVRVTLLLEKLPPRLRRALRGGLARDRDCWRSATSAWWAARFTWESYAFDDIAGGMVVIPIWIPQIELRGRRGCCSGRGAGRAGDRAARRQADVRATGRRAPCARRLLGGHLKPTPPCHPSRAGNCMNLLESARCCSS